MSEATFEATQAEAFEATGDTYEGEGGEASYEGDSAGEASYEGWGEDARSRRRARQRQIMLERQRQARLRRPPVRPPVTPPPSPAVSEVRSEVRSLDLETKVALDSLRGRLNEANRLAYRNAWAAEASVAASQVLDSFEDGLEPHDWARALIRVAPTAFVAPGKPIRPGVAGYLLDPRVAGGATTAAIFAIGHYRGATHGVSSIDVSPDEVTLVSGDTITLYGEAVDKKGNGVDGVDLTWAVTNNSVASLDKNTGSQIVCTAASGQGDTQTQITVKGGGATARVRVTVVPAAPGAGPSV